MHVISVPMRPHTILLHNVFAYLYILQKADLAVASLTITRLRENYVDFTLPYIDLGLLFAIKQETPATFFR